MPVSERMWGFKSPLAHSCDVQRLWLFVFNTKPEKRVALQFSWLLVVLTRPAAVSGVLWGFVVMRWAVAGRVEADGWLARQLQRRVGVGRVMGVLGWLWLWWRLGENQCGGCSRRCRCRSRFGEVVNDY